MAVSDYLQKSGGVCRYSYSKLKDVLYLVSAEHVKNVHIDNGEAYIDELTELPLRINGFNIQFNEETSLDERYKFQKTLTLSMHGYVNYKIFGGRYYAIIEDMEGVFYMINVDFPSRITHTFNLNYNTNQTDFTFASLSNFPTLKLNAEFEAVSPVCLGLNVYGIDKLELLEKEKARLDTINKQVISTESFKKIEFLGNSCSFQEVYDGNKVTDTIQFNIALDNYKPSWQYNLLEFLDNRYSAIITPKGNDNKYYPGYNFGLQPSYTIQTSNNPGESDIITITLVEMSSYGSTSAVDWKDEQSTETRWRWVKKVGDTICYECIGYGRARYLVRQQIDYFGNPTGNYQVMEGYESEYPNFHIVDTFTTEEIFETSDCSDSESCQIESTLPNTIYFNAITCNTYTLKTSCNWEITNIPENITVEPMVGLADTNYTLSICNTAEPTATPIENRMNLKCCKTNKVINFKTQIDSSCIRPQRQYINCLSQDVTFTFDGTCRINITSIDSRLTYSIGNNTLTVRVPRNYGDSAITWSIIATNCDCSTASTVVYINQDKQYERWIVSDGYTCENGNSYKVERKYTGTTQDNINTRTDETRRGEIITSGDTRCNSSQTKWEWDNESYYCVNGNKFQAVFEYISYDGGTTWVKTGNTRLGDMVEESSDFCLSGVTYSWEITSRYECDGTTSYYLYQKYEQRGEQEPIPTYPNYWSKDGDGTMSASKKQDNDPNCGYVPPVTPMYDWVVKDGTEYWCEDYNKYQKLYKRVSYNNGATWEWVLPFETQKGELIQEASTDCGYVANFERWVESGTTCIDKDLYYVEVKETSYDNIVWHTTSETRTGNLIERNSMVCGYIPPSEYEYRWVETGEYVCESGDSAPIYYRWVDDIDETICEGYVKRYLRIKEYNAGTGWFDTGERMPGQVLETFSTDCNPEYTEVALSTRGNRVCSGGTKYTILMKQIKADNKWTYKYPFEFSFNNTGIASDNCFKFKSSVNCLGGEGFERTIDCDDTYYLTFNEVYESGMPCINNYGSISKVTMGDCIIVAHGSASHNNCVSDSLTVIDGTLIVNESDGGLKNVVILTDNSLVYCNDTDNAATMGNKLEVIGRSVIRDSGSIILPSTVSFVSSSAFYYPDNEGIHGTINMGACSQLKRIEFETFTFNKKLTDVVLPPNLEIIDDEAFYECESLSSVTIPNSVKYIGDHAFAICYKLKNITIPSSVEYIGNSAFLVYPRNISEDLIRTVNVLSEDPPLIYWDSEIFGTPGRYNTHVYSLRINVPNNSLEKYKNAPGWRNYKNYIYGV